MDPKPWTCLFLNDRQNLCKTRSFLSFQSDLLMPRPRTLLIGWIADIAGPRFGILLGSFGCVGATASAKTVWRGGPDDRDSDGIHKGATGGGF
jgi:hypothetical protein